MDTMQQSPKIFTRENVLFAAGASIIIYLLFFALSVNAYSIDDNLSLFRDSSVYIQNFVTRGRLSTLLQVWIDETTILNLVNAYLVLLFAFIFLTVLCCRYFGEVIGGLSELFVFAIALIILTSPITLELVYFRIGLVQYIAIVAGVLALLRLMSAPQTRLNIALGILVIAFALGGYSASFAIIAGIIAIMSILQMTRFQDPRHPMTIVLVNGMMFIAGFVLYSIVWKILQGIFDHESKFSAAFNLQFVLKNLANTLTHLKTLLFTISIQNPFPLVLIVVLAAFIPFLFQRPKTDASQDGTASKSILDHKSLPLVLISLITVMLVLVAMFSFHLLVFSGRVPPLRAFFGAVFVGTLIAALVYASAGKYLRLYISIMIAAQAVLYSLNAANVNWTLHQLDEYDQLITQKILWELDKYEDDRGLYIYVDSRSRRWTRFNENLVGAMSSHYSAYWSAYPHFKYVTGLNPASTVARKSQNAREFHATCNQKRNELFIAYVEEKDGTLFFCL